MRQTPGIGRDGDPGIDRVAREGGAGLTLDGAVASP